MWHEGCTVLAADVKAGVKPREKWGEGMDERVLELLEADGDAPAVDEPTRLLLHVKHVEGLLAGLLTDLERFIGHS